MAHRGIDGRVDGIIKWLERFRSSYGSGAMETALMDAECARADMEDLRVDIWNRVGAERLPRRFWGWGVLCGALTAAFIVLATAAPLSVALPAFEAQETEPAAAVAKQLAPESETAVRPEPQEKPRPRRARRAAAVQTPAAARAGSPVEAAARKKIVPYDRMFSLLQTGSRALRGGESAIEVKGMGKGEGKL